MKTFRKVQTLKLRKPHGLKGSFFADFFIGAPSNLEGKILTDENNQKYEVEKIFGVTKNNLRVKFKEFNSIDEISHLRNVFLYEDSKESGFFLEDLIGCILKDEEKEIGKILGIEDYSAGLLLDIEGADMILAQEVEISSFDGKHVYMKKTMQKWIHII